MRRAKPDRDSPSDMHYASASLARERDRLSRNSGRRKGIFRACLSSRSCALLILTAFGFALYCFETSYEFAIPWTSKDQVRNRDAVKAEQSVGTNVKLQHNVDSDVGEDGSRMSNRGNDNAVESIHRGADMKDRNDNEQADNGHIFKYHILQTLTNTDRMPHLKTRFEVCMKSILEKSSINLLFIFVVDGPSRDYLQSYLQDITNQQIAKSKFQFIFLDIEDVAKELDPLVKMMQSQIQRKHPYYKDSIFFLSTMLHKDLLPEYVHRVIMLDTDLKFMTDIKELFEHFDHFQGDNIIGIVHEQQPVYRHIFSLYRSQNQGTRVGDPPPNGLAGFNSGVLLLDFDRMRRSEHFEHFMKPEIIIKMRDKYHFKGHLGDQDFYTLISMEKEDLFYNVPCSWNKQLCQWWKDKGYQAVWDQYFVCNEKINIYHGNCNTPIPF